MNSAKNILERFKKKWQLLLLATIVIYAIGPAFLVYVLSANMGLFMLMFGFLFLIGFLIKKPWHLTLGKVGDYIDGNLESAEYSTSLLLLPEEELSSVAHLQRYRVREILSEGVSKLRPAVSLKKPILVSVLFLLITIMAYQFNWTLSLNKPSNAGETEAVIAFTPLDTTNTLYSPPKIMSQLVQIRYPRYSGIGARSTSDMNVKALEGTRLSWQLQFDAPVEKVFFESLDEAVEMRSVDKGYTYQMSLGSSGFYNVTFQTSQGTSYQSELYTLEMIKDQSPEINVQGLQQFTSFDLKEEKTLAFETVVEDDYGVSEVYITATVSRGEGESVKFREERLPFGQGVLASSTKKQRLSKKISLDRLGMVPGDELYFYITAIDNKVPKPNRTRSETYFAVIRDTVQNQFAVEGTMGADLMPDYFRSQRQLIIDTEKLIADQSKLATERFNFTSNELGFDQKALRLKYGQFMGDESESVVRESEETEVSESDQQDEDSEDPLEEYTHDHDVSNEHNLVDHDHGDDHEETDTEEDPLERYLHNHDDPEESTLFTQSLKSKLRQAMAEMWDAELYLRLYTPKKSLPYQYRALKLIQEIKNSARIYVHRIGFDPPPIKEDKRLTGTLDEVVNSQKREDLAKDQVYPHMKQAAERLEQLLQGQAQQESDQSIFARAGEELAAIAILEPGNYLGALQRLKWLSDSNTAYDDTELRMVLGALLRAIPSPEYEPERQQGHQGRLDQLFLKELEIND